MTFSMETFQKRLSEPSTWASMAAVAAMLTGHDPGTTANTAMNAVAGVAALIGVFMPEGTPTHPNPPTA